MNHATLELQSQRFLRGLERSPHTVRAYGADLRHLTAWLVQAGQPLTPDSLDAYFAAHPAWAASTRHREQTALERFYRWAVQRSLLDRDPTLRLECPALPPSHPRGLRREEGLTWRRAKFWPTRMRSFRPWSSEPCNNEGLRVPGGDP